MTLTRAMRRPGRCQVVRATTAAFFALTLAPAVSGAADHTWSGAGAAPFQSGAGTWSDAANWSAGGAPVSGETIGTLAFPALTDPACNTTFPTLACGRGTNDLTGLTVGTLTIDDAGADIGREGAAYGLTGNGITLTGGLTASPGTSGGDVLDTIGLPITLGAPQTWTVEGNPPPAPGGIFHAGGILLSAPVSGPAHALTIRLSSTGTLSLSGDNEVGPVSVIGAGAITGPLGPPILSVSMRALLNAADGNPVSITNAQLDAFGQFGPLTISQGVLQVGRLPTPAGTATSPSVQFDSASRASFLIPGGGSVAGFDYAQLSSTGPITLGGASLEVAAGSGEPSARCPSPPMGSVYTLVSTTGTLTGTFDVPQGGIVRLGEISPCSALPYALRIEYHESGSPQTVTGTVVPAPPLGVAPGVAGAAPVSGTVLVRRRGQARFGVLKRGALIPAGSEFDTTRGRVRLFVATNRRGGTRSAQVYSGRFVFRQSGKARLRTKLRLSQPLDGCRGVRRANATASRHRRRHRARHVWVTEHGGDIGTTGQYVGTSVQGTTWLTGDTCATSFVRVRHGTVTVHDLVRHRSVKLHAGQSYTVRKPR